MGKADWFKTFFKNKQMVKIVSIIVAVVIVIVSVFAIAPKFFSDSEEKNDVAVNKTVVEESKPSESESEEAEQVIAQEAEYVAAFIVSINPKLKIYVDKNDIVVKIEHLNSDAEILLDSFEWDKKSLKNCFKGLLEKAFEDGFLKEDGTISILAENHADANVSSMLKDMEDSALLVCKANKIDVTMKIQESESEEIVQSLLEGSVMDDEQENIMVSNRENVDVATEDLLLVPLTETEQKKENEKPASGENEDNNTSSSDNTPSAGPAVTSGYKLVWEDNFNGSELNRDDWNVELHAPGWVNAEWQEYVDSEENIYLKDGKLVLQAIKTTKDGKDYYTSGRVNTQNKHDFKYGKFEAKIKVPSGMGFLPAFWMMPTDEQKYGQWPKCGEIDIMEVMGQSTDTLHGTIHYGDPHGQKQGTYIIDGAKADFAEGFHVYTCEWEPGKISWFVDGVKFHEATDWYTKREGFDEVAYPAPFDQPFYMIFNVAVGGSWVGYPDETTEFGDNAQMVVDYVKVYQKDKYNENVVKPAKPEVPDSEIGANILVNGEFTKNESFDDGKDWEFLTANGGEGNAQIVDVDGNNALKITTTNAGTVDYSVQLVQGPIALKQGNKYKVSFDAWADEERTMKALISAPDLNYMRYWGDQTVNLTTTKQQFSYEFEMTEEGDANSRFEMTFGAMGSTAAVYIDNVKVEKTDSFEIIEEGKTVLPDGNYVYNSGFDTGSDRMKYWAVDSRIAGVNYCATNEDGVREFKAVVPSRVSSLEDVVLKQEDTAISGGKEYLFTFDAYGAEAKAIKAVISPKTSTNDVEDIVFDVNLDTVKNNYEFNFTMPTGVTGADVKFLIGAAGTTYIDNVRVQEDATIINGDFSNGTAGWELYAYAPSDVSFVIDELDNGSGSQAAALNIAKSGPVDWHIQLKQPVTLEQGKKYRISFDTWSTIERNFVFAIQRNADKKGDSDWISYSGDINEAMSTTGFKHYSKEFDMTWVTDDIAEVKFTLGAVGGVEINTPHTVFIDNVVLEEIGTCEVPDGSDGPTVVEGENMFTNPNFDGMDGWTVTWDSQWGPGNTGSATVTTENNTLVYDVTNVGAYDYSVQLKQEGLDFEEGATYRASFDVSSTVARIIKFALMDAGNNWYAGKDVIEVSPEMSTVSFEFKPLDGKDSYEDLIFQLSLGKVDENTSASTLTFANMKLVKLETQQPEEVQPVNVTLSDISLVKTADENGTNLATGEWVGAGSVEDGSVKVTVTDPKTNPWDVQLQQFGINLEANCEYKLTFKGSADAAKLIQVGLQQNGGSYTVYSLIENQNIAARLGTDEQSYTIVFTMNAAGDDNATLFFNLGNVTEQNAGYILSADGEQQETPGEGGETPSAPAAGELISNGDFSKGTEGWSINNNSPAVATVDASNGIMTYNISDVGTTNWHLQLAQSDLQIEQGATYHVSFTIKSSVARQVKWTVMEDGNKTGSWNLWYAGAVLDLEGESERTITADFTANEACDTAMFQFTMAPDGDDMPLTDLVNSPVSHSIEIDNVSLVKVSDAEAVSLMSLPNPEVLEESVEEETVDEEGIETESNSEESAVETTEEINGEETATDTTTEEDSEEKASEDAFVEPKTEDEEEFKEVTEDDENVPSESVQNE